MTKNEMGAIIAMINAAYPNHFARVADIDMLVDMWASLFAGYSGEQVTAALKQYMVNDTKGYGPAPGQLIYYLDKAAHPEDLNATDAWNMVMRAAANGNYGAEEEFQKLPETVQRTIGSAYYLQQLALSDLESNSVLESHFKRDYRIQLERDREDRKVQSNILKTLTARSQEALNG